MENGIIKIYTLTLVTWDGYDFENLESVGKCLDTLKENRRLDKLPVYSKEQSDDIEFESDTDYYYFEEWEV